jgi:uncharacterized protein YcaQ
LSKDRSILEFWGHAASYLPMTDFRFTLPRKQLFPKSSNWEMEYWQQFGGLAAEILQRIRLEGPLSAKDFADSRKEKFRGGLSDWKPAKVVLELLLWKGDLMVSARPQFQRLYDLTERVLPPNVNTTMPTTSEIGRFYVNRAIQAQGISSAWDIEHHFLTHQVSAIQSARQEMLESGEIIPVQIENDALTYYTTPEILQSEQIRPPHPMYFLSPFDNLTILRPRLQRLFHFDYTLECYVPQAKRKFGYWSLPILHRDRMIGRIDCKAERKKRELWIQHLHFETDIKPDADLASVFALALTRFCRFNQCGSVVWQIDRPARFIKTVTTRLNRLLQEDNHE